MAERRLDPPGDAAPTLEVKGIRKSFGSLEVLKGVSLQVPEGSTILDARASLAIFATVEAALESCRTGQPVEVL